MFAPGEGLGELPPIASPVDMKAATARQVEAFRAMNPQEPIGGEFTVHEVHGWGTIARRMGQLD